MPSCDYHTKRYDSRARRRACKCWLRMRCRRSSEGRVKYPALVSVGARGLRYDCLVVRWWVSSSAASLCSSAFTDLTYALDSLVVSATGKLAVTC